MKKRLIPLSIFLLCVMILAGTMYAQGSSHENKTEKTAAEAEDIQIAIEVLNISKFEVATGKYTAELGIYVQFPFLDLPSGIDYEVFENEITAKMKKEDKKELEKYYEYNDNNYEYDLKEGATEQECLRAYRIIKSSGYYESNLPFELVNGKIEKNQKTGKPEIERVEDTQDPGFIYYRFNAEMSAKFNFKYFPFDNQSLSIKLASPFSLSEVVYRPLESTTLLPDKIEFAVFETQIIKKANGDQKKVLLNSYLPNREKVSYLRKDGISKADERKVRTILDSFGFNSLISGDVTLPGWSIREGEPVYGTDSYLKWRYSTLTFPMTLSRDRLSAFLKVFVPLLILMLASFVSLFLGPSVIGNRYTVTAGMLLACAMLHLNATSSIPQTGYLTMADKIFISSYLSILLNLVASVMIIVFNEKKQEKTIKKTYFVALWLVPVLTLLLYLLIFTHVI